MIKKLLILFFLTLSFFIFPKSFFAADKTCQVSFDNLVAGSSKSSLTIKDPTDGSLLTKNTNYRVHLIGDSICNSALSSYNCPSFGTSSNNNKEISLQNIDISNRNNGDPIRSGSITVYVTNPDVGGSRVVRNYVCKSEKINVTQQGAGLGCRGTVYVSQDNKVYLNALFSDEYQSGDYTNHSINVWRLDANGKRTGNPLNSNQCLTNTQLQQPFPIFTTPINRIAPVVQPQSGCDQFNDCFFPNGRFDIEIHDGCGNFNGQEICHVLTPEITNEGGDGTTTTNGNACSVCPPGTYQSGENPPTCLNTEPRSIICDSTQNCDPVLGCVDGFQGNISGSENRSINTICDNVGADGNCESVDSGIGSISTKAGGFVSNVLAVVLSLIGGIALILIIISGYRLMISQGNPEAIQAAREQLTAAIVGLLFVIFSLLVLEVIGVNILNLSALQ